MKNRKRANESYRCAQWGQRAGLLQWRVVGTGNLMTAGIILPDTLLDFSAVLKHPIEGKGWQQRQSRRNSM